MKIEKKLYTSKDLKKAFDAGYDYRNQETEDGSPFRPAMNFKTWYTKFRRHDK
jgi:hypothetical protein